MPPRRATNKRLTREKGLGAGVQLERSSLPSKPVESANGFGFGFGFDYSESGSDRDPWGWVLNPVRSVSEIKEEHLLRACGISLSASVGCLNKYAVKEEVEGVSRKKRKLENDGMDFDRDTGTMEVIVVSSEDEDCKPPAVRSLKHACSKKGCKSDSRCLNYLGQELWEDEKKSRTSFSSNFMQMFSPNDPTLLSRDPKLPVGLKNLGATCYANALLQVWFNNPSFVSGVYSCASVTQNGLSVSSENRNDHSTAMMELARTFAHLEHSKLKFFNPERLVDSLGLRTEEQQDAQEFAKLFMELLSHSENGTGLGKFVAEQFEGKRSYGTHCHACKSVSEREESFLELELRLQDGLSLEELILQSLESEDLDQDNLYECPSCETRSTATRTVKLTSLPPVLHFSLMRFVFDMKTFTKRKSKASIKIPREIDMSAFLGKSQDGQTVKYQLRGLLLHKGGSANRGHYVCQALRLDERKWFQYDDEWIVPLGSIPDAEVAKGPIKVTKDSTKNLKRKAKEARQLKFKTTVRSSSPSRESSADELNIMELDMDSASPLKAAFKKAESLSSPAPASREKQKADCKPSYFNSKDAYMLVYGINDQNSRGTSNGQKTPTPPNFLSEVDGENDKHKQACDKYKKSLEYCSFMFERIKEAKQVIYRSWHAVHAEGTVPFVAAAGPLSGWVTRELSASSVSRSESQAPNQMAAESAALSTSTPAIDVDAKSEVLTGHIDNSMILCRHGKLDPTKGGEMKVIYADQLRPLLCPVMTTSDVCSECVASIFNEKLLRMKHNAAVDLIRAQMAVEEPSPGAWVSRQWIKEWCVKISERQAGREKPSPQSSEYSEDVLCEHGLLQPDVNTRRVLNGEAIAVLRHYFPDWCPPPEDAVLCEICSDKEEIALAEIKQQINKEKASDLLQDAFHEISGPETQDPQVLSDLRGSTLVLVPFAFVSDWKQWTRNPQHNERPEVLDNTWFLCEHNHLLIDFKDISKFDPEYALMDHGYWEKLCSLYRACPLIAFYPKGHEREGESAKFCEGCYIERKSDFKTAQLTVLHVHPEHTLENVSTEQAVNAPIATSGTQPRRSTRVSKARGSILGRVTLKVTKADTVQNVKKKAAGSFNIAVSAQRIFYRGTELTDNTATMADIKLMTNSTIYLKEASIELDDEEEKDAEMEAGFSGTKLHLSSRTRAESKVNDNDDIEAPLAADDLGNPDSSAPMQEDLPVIPGLETILNGDPNPSSPMAVDSKVGSKAPTPAIEQIVNVCPACTLINEKDAKVCGLCETVLTIL